MKSKIMLSAFTVVAIINRLQFSLARARDEAIKNAGVLIRQNGRFYVPVLWAAAPELWDGTVQIHTRKPGEKHATIRNWQVLNIHRQHLARVKRAALMLRTGDN